MPDVNAAEVRPTPDPNETVGLTPPPVRRQRASRTPGQTPNAKPRTIEELENTAIKAMTDPERIKYIEYLRDQVCLKDGQNQMLDANCRKAYEQCRYLEQKLSDYKMKAQAKLQFAKQAVQTCATSIILAGNVED